LPGTTGRVALPLAPSAGGIGRRELSTLPRLAALSASSRSSRGGEEVGEDRLPSTFRALIDTYLQTIDAKHVKRKVYQPVK
jgi:hypothetical protein